MRPLYRISMSRGFGTDTTKYSTAGCGSCISMVLASGLRLATAHRVPLLIVDCVASHQMFGDDPRRLIADRLRMSDPARVVFVAHHVAHAASAYYPLSSTTPCSRR